jgi:hypothetical protein
MQKSCANFIDVAKRQELVVFMTGILATKFYIEIIRQHNNKGELPCFNYVNDVTFVRVYC